MSQNNWDIARVQVELN